MPALLIPIPIHKGSSPVAATALGSVWSDKDANRKPCCCFFLSCGIGTIPSMANRRREMSRYDVDSIPERSSLARETNRVERAFGQEKARFRLSHLGSHFLLCVRTHLHRSVSTDLCIDRCSGCPFLFGWGILAGSRVLLREHQRKADGRTTFARCRRVLVSTAVGITSGTHRISVAPDEVKSSRETS